MKAYKAQFSATLTAILLFFHSSAASQAVAAGSLSELAGSVVRVEYELQYDKADAPTGALGNERCPNCGQFHGADLREYLQEERPVEVAGFLVAKDRVLTADPQIHPRFIKRITVRSGSKSAIASIAAHATGHSAIFLSLDSAMADVTPLAFDAGAGPAARLLTGLRESGQWVCTQIDFPNLISLADGERPHRVIPTRGLALSASGQPVGAVFNNFLPADESWLGSPLDWPRQSAAELKKHLEALDQVVNRGLLRVTLTFRSPAGGDDEMTGGRRYSSYANSDEGDATVRNVIGILLPGNQVLVLAHLEPRVTARLEAIRVFGADGEAVPATFTASLKRFGALVATLEKPMKGALKMARMDMLAGRERLLLRADVQSQGETRSSYLQSGRYGSCKLGPRSEVYPELTEVAQSAFLFTTGYDLVALPVKHREQVSGESSRYSYSRYDVELVPARLLAEAVSNLAASADPNNLPRTVEEENRLAWLGVELQPMNRDLARANNVAGETRDGETGALVTAINEGSPAAKAGIPVGAILLRLKVPGQPLPVEVQMEEDMMRAQAFPWDRLDEVPDQYFDRIPQPWPTQENAFTRALTDLGFGTKYTAEFFVGGKIVAHEFEVVAGPPDFESAPRLKSEKLGVTVRDLTYDVRRYLQRAPDETGVVVSKIETGSKASVAGVKPYELITHINDQPVNNVKDFEKLSSASGELKLSIKRMNRGRIATIKAGE